MASRQQARSFNAIWLTLIAMALTAAVYWPGLSGGWLFDDYPNIVDNPGVQPHEMSVPALARAAMSSPASEFKRPLASLSFAANYLVSGLDPYSWKLVNLIIHLLNGVLVFLLAKALLQATTTHGPPVGAHLVRDAFGPGEERASRTRCALTWHQHDVGIIAALIAASWMLLPINLTAVLYVVQREESLANLFVLLGLIGYMAGRRRMLARSESIASLHAGTTSWGGFALCTGSLVLPTAVGILVKETAVMLPLYAFLIEWIVFRFDTPSGSRDRRLLTLFVAVLVLPMIIGLTLLWPSIVAPSSWATRDFTLEQRLLSEARVVCDYLAWALLPTPHALSFYHDQFPVSTGLLKPWTTAASIGLLGALVALVFGLRQRNPLVALGIALFLGCQLLTGTILPLELVYEHRNYFASFGLLLALIPLLARPTASATASRQNMIMAEATPATPRAWSAWLRYALLATLMLWWAGLTAATAYAWGNPLRLTRELAARAPDSPRAQYELGRTYIIYSHYDPASPYTRLAYAPLERAAAMPESSVLPQQALIFMNSRMHLPLKDTWWDSMIAKLKAREPGVQDESSLTALVKCARDNACPLPKSRMMEAFKAALDHPNPDPRLQASYGDYAWNVLDDHGLGLRMTTAAAQNAPQEPAYHITLVRMACATHRYTLANRQLKQLEALNIGGRFDKSIAELRALLPSPPVSN